MEGSEEEKVQKIMVLPWQGDTRVPFLDFSSGSASAERRAGPGSRSVSTRAEGAHVPRDRLPSPPAFLPVCTECSYFTL